MAHQKILVVEDDEDIYELVRYNLSKEGFDIVPAPSAEIAISRLRRETVDLVVLDLMLPGMDGFQFCRMLKKDSKTENLPVIMLTAKGEEADIVAGLELGADDYIIKPFSPRVLIARIKAVFRRNARGGEILTDAPIYVHDMVIHPGRHEVTIDDKTVNLTFTEFRVLQFLAGRPGWVFTRLQIVDAVRGDNYPVTERSIDVVIVGLRKKLGKASRYVETVRGIGYRLREKND